MEKQIMFWIATMLLHCKDKDLAGFFSNIASFSVEGVESDPKEWSMDTLLEAKKVIINQYFMPNLEVQPYVPTSYLEQCAVIYDGWTDFTHSIAVLNEN